MVPGVCPHSRGAAPALAFCRSVWYAGNRKESSFSAANYGKRLALRQGAASCPLIFGKGGCPMVTYSELFQYTLVIIGIIGLFIAANKKK